MLAALGLFILQVGWILVMPPFAGIDEFDHAFRADSVAHGHWQPGSDQARPDFARGDYILVRSDIAAAANAACADVAYTGPFNCRPLRDAPNGEVVIASAAARYNPLFYAVVGTAGRPFHSDTALYAMRICVALICAAFFALSVWVTARWATTKWPYVALGLAMLPTTVYSTSIVSPNGVEMMAGVALWSALLALYFGPGSSRTAFYAIMCLAAAALANTHTLGIMWLALALVSSAFLVGPRCAVTFLWPRSKLEWAAAVLAAGATAFDVIWLLAARPNDPSIPEGGLSGSPWKPLAEAIVLWPLQSIGAFPRRNDAAPVAVYACAIVAIGAFLCVAAVALRGQMRLVLTALVVAGMSLAVPMLLTVATYHELGMSWQGRYGMPYSAGLFLVLAAALDRSPRFRGATVQHLAATVGCAVWVVAQMIGQLGLLRLHRDDFFLSTHTGWWAPPMFLIVIIGIGAWLVWVKALGRVDEQTPDRGASSSLVT